MHKTLYLGSSPKNFTAKGDLLHLPLIKIEPRNFSLFSIRTAFDDFHAFTHIIFTSKNAVTIFFEALKYFSLEIGEQEIIAVGEVTACALKQHGASVRHIAKQETQEGVMHELALLDLDEAYLFVPCSARARPALAQNLRNRQLRHKVCHLYDTVAVQPKKKPNLDEIDTIVFTSPSTVEAFVELYGILPKEKELISIGPITRTALKNRT